MIEEFIKIIEHKTSLSEENCEKIRVSCEKDRSKLVEAAIETKLVLEDEVLEVLSQLYAIPYTKFLLMENVRDDWTASISRQFLKKFCIAPLPKDDGSSLIAINDPSDMSIIDDVAAGIFANLILRISLSMF